jgi:hypothetical protein
MSSNTAGMSSRLLSNKEEAFERMLPEETAKVNYMREELEYFVNTMHSETKRMLHTDYEESRDNFVDMGEMSMRFVHEYSSKWLDFVKYFSTINDQRIDGEKKFVELNQIGEEIMNLDIGLDQDGEKDTDNLPTFDDEDPINKSKTSEQPLISAEYDADKVK